VAASPPTRPSRPRLVIPAGPVPAKAGSGNPAPLWVPAPSAGSGQALREGDLKPARTKLFTMGTTASYFLRSHKPLFQRHLFGMVKTVPLHKPKRDFAAASRILPCPVTACGGPEPAFLVRCFGRLRAPRQAPKQAVTGQARVPSRKFANKPCAAGTLCRSPLGGGILWPRAKALGEQGPLPPFPPLPPLRERGAGG
jgi:hypothetical protein